MSAAVMGVDDVGKRLDIFGKRIAVLQGDFHADRDLQIIDLSGKIDDRVQGFLLRFKCLTKERMPPSKKKWHSSLVRAS